MWRLKALTGWSQLTPRPFSYTEPPLWKAKRPKKHKPQGFLNKTSRSLLWNLVFLWRLEQKHTCKSVSLLVRIKLEHVRFFQHLSCRNKTQSLWAIRRRIEVQGSNMDARLHRQHKRFVLGSASLWMCHNVGAPPGCAGHGVPTRSLWLGCSVIRPCHRCHTPLLVLSARPTRRRFCCQSAPASPITASVLLELLLWRQIIEFLYIPCELFNCLSVHGVVTSPNPVRTALGDCMAFVCFQISVNVSLKSHRSSKYQLICFTCHFPKAPQQGCRFSPIHVETASAWANVCYLWFQLEVRCLSGTGRHAYQDRPARPSHYHMSIFHRSHVTASVLSPSVSHCERCMWMQTLHSC